ncbi:MAG: DUF1501 domain-containing protein [Xanthomonadales bacterium]|nr:DUF1501 domain-containing protein [Xanthomonadales bacterium]
MDRRQFLKTNALGGLTAASALPTAARAGGTGFNQEILVYVFLRGGIDGLNVIVPLDDNDHEYYSVMRPRLAIPDAGPGAALPISGEPFGFNPLASPLKDLYDQGYMAVVQAAGTPDPVSSRSHFDAEKYVELGTPGLLGTSTGWLQRHFLAMTETLDLYPDEMLLPIVAYRNNPPVSLLGNTSLLTVWDPQIFRMNNAHWHWNEPDPNWPQKGDTQIPALNDIYGYDVDAFSRAGAQALTAEGILRQLYSDSYTSAGSTPYQDNSIASQLASTAQLIKLDLETRIFTLDWGNFDSHANQNLPDYFDTPLDQLCRAVSAFFEDLDASGGDYADRTTMIIQSEFGRRGYENISVGTDHGNGNILLAIGKQVNGGRLYGTWPGLYPGTADGFVNYANPKNGSTDPELYEGALATTTDFRRVLSEFLAVRCRHTPATLASVFPDYSGYSPMGIFQAQDRLFQNGFESPA